MENRRITISDNGTIIIPTEVRMNISEIADLFDIYYQSAKQHIRAIEKSGVADGDHSMCCTVEGQKVYTDYYGLEMVVTVAFRVQSPKTEIFRQWVCRRATQSSTQTVLTLLTQNAILN